MSITVSVKERKAFKLIQVNPCPTIQAMDREKEEKTPGNNPRGKASGARAVTRVGRAEGRERKAAEDTVEGFAKDDWQRAGDTARQFIAYLMWNVRRDEESRGL